jgi:hypothetical protein
VPNFDKLNEVKIYNSIGELVLSDKNAVINVSSLKPGTYFVAVHTHNNKFVKSFVKE